MSTPDSLNSVTSSEKNALAFLQWSKLTAVPARCWCGSLWHPHLNGNRLLMHCFARITPAQKLLAQTARAADTRIPPSARAVPAPGQRGSQDGLRCNMKVNWQTWLLLKGDFPNCLMPADFVKQMFYFANKEPVEKVANWTGDPSQSVLCVFVAGVFFVESYKTINTF